MPVTVMSKHALEQQCRMGRGGGCEGHGGYPQEILEVDARLPGPVHEAVNLPIRDNADRYPHLLGQRDVLVSGWDLIQRHGKDHLVNHLFAQDFLKGINLPDYAYAALYTAPDLARIDFKAPQYPESGAQMVADAVDYVFCPLKAPDDHHIPEVEALLPVFIQRPVCDPLAKGE